MSRLPSEGPSVQSSPLPIDPIATPPAACRMRIRPGAASMYAHAAHAYVILIIHVDVDVFFYMHLYL